MTTAVTVLSAQKKVFERREYCSENLRMTSTDLSDLSLEASAPAAAHNRYHISQFIPISVEERAEIGVHPDFSEGRAEIGVLHESGGIGADVVTYLELGRRICGGVLWAPSTTTGGRGAPRTQRWW